MLNFRAIAMAIIGLAGCGVALRKPYWGLLLIVFFYFFRPDLWGAEVYVRPVLWLTIATAIGWYFKKPTIYSHRSLSWLLVLFGFYALSTTLAPFSNAQSWVALKYIAKIFAMVFLITQICDTPKRLAGVFLVVLLGCVWFLKVSLIGWAVAGFSHTVRIDTRVGQGGGSNFIAWILATTIPFLVLKIINGRGWQRWVSVGLLPFWLTSIVVTGSRGGVLCLVASLGILLLITRRFKLVFVLLLLVLMFVNFMPEQRVERLKTITTDPKEMDKSLLQRYQNINIGVQIMSDYPLFGSGLDTFPTTKAKYLPRDYVGRKSNVAHNTFVQMGSEIGVIFLLTFIVLNFYTVYCLRKRSPEALNKEDAAHMDWVRYGLWGAYASTFVAMMKSDMAKMDFFWWFYGLAMAYEMVRERAVDALEAKKMRAEIKTKKEMPDWLKARLGVPVT